MMVKQSRSSFGALRRDIAGATAIEYALIATAISIVIVGGVALLGGSVTAMFQAVAAAFGG